jgi:hypothetical protein
VDQLEARDRRAGTLTNPRKRDNRFHADEGSRTARVAASASVFIIVRGRR